MAQEDHPHEVLLTTTPRESWLLVLGRQTNVRTLLVRFLTLAGYIVVGCATLAEAASVLERQAAPPAVILVDGAAASESALHEQLQQLARLLPHTTCCPMIALSLAQPLPRASQLPGNVTVVAQPFDLTDLLHVVATASALPPPTALP